MRKEKTKQLPHTLPGILTQSPGLNKLRTVAYQRWKCPQKAPPLRLSLYSREAGVRAATCAGSMAGQGQGLPAPPHGSQVTTPQACTDIAQTLHTVKSNDLNSLRVPDVLLLARHCQLAGGSSQVIL